MGLFDQLGQGTSQQKQGTSRQKQVTPEDMRKEINNIQQNLSAYLSQRGFTIPEGMTNPKDITVHLLKTGQIGSSKLRQLFGILGAR